MSSAAPRSPSPRVVSLAALAALALACSPVPPATGQASVHGTVSGLMLEGEQGYAIAHGNELKLSASPISCSDSLHTDHVTIDLGAATVGSYDVVPGYPLREHLAPAQARAHACPAATDSTGKGCFNDVHTGNIAITRYDPSPGQKIEGTFTLTFGGGELTGSFLAMRCD